MSDFCLNLNIRQENLGMFKRCVRKLLESTFILRDKDEKLYPFVARESNRQDISDYLRTIGFDVTVDDKAGVCMLIANEEDAETVGLKRANLVTFSTKEYYLMLILAQLYLNSVGYNEAVFVTKGDLIENAVSMGLTFTRTELNSALHVFKKRSLINFNEYDDGENMRIELYPSLQFGMDVGQFSAFMKEYLDDAANTQIDSDDQEEEEE